LRIAASPVIAILDSDDAWDPAYLREQMSILDARPHVGVVTGKAWFLGSSQNGRPARPWPDLRPAPRLAGMLADQTAVFAAAGQHLTALHHIKRGALLRLARFVARWTPSLLSTAYNMRRARLALSRAARQRIA
jgi:hypothetical protein